MKTKINVRTFNHVKRIEKFGQIFESVYCHNYYYDERNDMLVLSESDDDVEDTIIEFACDWIRNHVSVPFDGDCDENGHPLAADYISWATQRLEYAEELCDEFRDYINQRKNERVCTTKK